MKLPADFVRPDEILRDWSGGGGVGRRLLEKMGWNEGEGLGKEKDGMKKALRLKTQMHTRGLGHVAKSEWEDHPWTNIYEQSLEKIKCRTKGSKRKRKEKEKDGLVSCGQNPDGTRSTASKEELEIYHLLEQRSQHLGRWSARRGKLARIKKQELTKQDEASKQ